MAVKVPFTVKSPLTTISPVTLTPEASTSKYFVVPELFVTSRRLPVIGVELSLITNALEVSREISLGVELS